MKSTTVWLLSLGFWVGGLLVAQSQGQVQQAAGQPPVTTDAARQPDAPRSGPPAWAINKEGSIIHLHDEHRVPSTRPPVGLYVSMGDSITMGTGATQSCRAFPTYPVDIEEYCPDGTSYAILVAKGLRNAGTAGSFMNVGIGGANVEDLTTKELPYVPANATIVSVYIGTNDSRKVRKPDLPIQQAVQQFEESYESLLENIHARAPRARIILINFPNQKYMAEPGRFPDDVLERFDISSQLLAKFIDGHYPKYTVVDTICNPASYDVSMRYEVGVHPNDAGSVVLAQSVLKAILSPPEAPPQSCQWYDESRASQLSKRR